MDELHDITGVTGQPCWRRRRRRRRRLSLSISLLCPLREMRFSLRKPAARRPGTGEETLRARWKLLNSGLPAGHGRFRVVEFFCGFPGCAPAAERTAQCDSRRLWRKPYLVKVFVAVTQRDRPAINSAGGGTEINAKTIPQAVKQANWWASHVTLTIMRRATL